MPDWIVTVGRIGNPERKRVFVEDIPSIEEAETVALLKLGANPDQHEARAEFVDARVSMDTIYADQKELYEKVVVELSDIRQKYQEETSLSSTYLQRAEAAETEHAIIIREDVLIQSNLAAVNRALDNIHKTLHKRGKRGKK